MSKFSDERQSDSEALNGERGDRMPSKDVEHNVFCNFDVAEVLTQFIDSLPPTTCVSMRREMSIAEFREFLDWYLEDAQKEEKGTELCSCQ